MSLDLDAKQIKGYTFRDIIGEGGFAFVYRAYQSVIEREVAVKVIIPILADHPQFIQHFETEAQLVARLEHPFIVPLYDYWREPGSAYLVMRLLKGGNLRRVLSQGLMSPANVIRFTGQIASALARAHYSGVVHRDLKPENILLDENDNAYLSDFGLAWILNQAADSSDNDFEGFGSPAYAAPEQFTGGVITASADQYSLAVILYELLTGYHPIPDIENSSFTQIITKKNIASLPPLSSMRTDLPFQMDKILQKATALDPKDRFPNVIEFANEFCQTLAAFVQQEALQSTDSRQFALSIVDQANLALSDTYILPNPYKGLRAFQQADAEDFFGREKLVSQLLSRLADKQELFSQFLAVVGPSGSGKSSLVKAGVIPALRQGLLNNKRDWLMIELTPGNQPFAQIEAAFRRVAFEDIPDLAVKLREKPGELIKIIEQLLPSDTQVLLFIDQFEEAFTLIRDETDRKYFFQTIFETVTDPQSRIHIIITLRADFYDRPLSYPQLSQLLRLRTEVIIPMSSEEIQRSIVEPAKRVRLHIEPALVTAITQEIYEQPGMLPLLQFTLSELFDRRTHNTLTLEDYQNNGGISGALVRRAEEIFQGLSPLQQELTRQIFLRLVTLGEGSEDTRRRVFHSELFSLQQDRQQIQFVLDAFGTPRLLTFDRDAITRLPTVEIAHEALIRQWQRLREWLNVNRDELRSHRQLGVVASDWLKNNCDKSFLATGAQLAQYEPLIHASQVFLNENELTFVEASIRNRRRAAQRLIAFIIVLIILLIAASGFGLYALDQTRRAEVERDRANTETNNSRSRELAVRSLLNQRQPDLALLLSLGALHIADSFEARNSLLITLQNYPRLNTFLHEHTDQVRSIDYNSSLALFASAGRDGQINLWSKAAQNFTAQPLGQPHGTINSIQFSADGKLMVSGGEDRMIRLWDVPSRLLLGQPLVGHEEVIWSVALSPDDTFAASGDAQGMIILWEVASAREITRLEGHTGSVYTLEFSSNGQLLASAGADNIVRLWNVKDRQLLATFTGHQNWVWDVSFNPEDTLLASASADNTVRLWDIDSGESRVLEGHRDWVRGVEFSPNGQLLFSVSVDGQVLFWRVDDGQIVDTLTTFSDSISDFAYDPENQVLAIVGGNQTISLWNIRREPPLGHTIARQETGVTTLALSPNQTEIAVAGDADGDIYLWDTTTLGAAPAKTLSKHQAAVNSLVYHPTLPLLVSGSGDSNLWVWDLANGESIGQARTNHQQGIFSLVFTSTGTVLASGGNDGSILLWDTQKAPEQWQVLKDGLLQQQTQRITSLSFSPDNRLLASASLDGTITIWNIETRQPLYTSETAHSGGVLSVAFSPDGRMLASGGRDSMIILWDVESGEPIDQPLTSHESWILSLAFSPDGSLLASSSGDESIILWDVLERRPLGNRLLGHSDWVNQIKFNAMGDELISTGRDGRIITWEVSLPSWHRRACHIINRSFSTQEWQQYLPDVPVEPFCDPIEGEE